MVPLPSFVHRACESAIKSAATELKYDQSAHAVNLIAKDEDIRRLRVDIHILEDDNDELRELLQQEEDRADAFEALVADNLVRAETAEARLRDAEADLRGREQELATALAENDALRASGEDATAALTAKLALTRELSVLRPELEHLRAQAASAEKLLEEKLALQRQVTSLQCECEHARREAQRALAKRRNTGAEIAQEVQMEELRRLLAKEKHARLRAEEAADSITQEAGKGDDIRKELVRERRARQKADERADEVQQQVAQVEEVRKDLLGEKKMRQELEEEVENLRAEIERERKAGARAAKRTDGNAHADNEVEELRLEVERERKERAKAERAAAQLAETFKAQKATLDDKLNQFRTKLRTTKEKLKEAETALAAAATCGPTTAVSKKTLSGAAPAAAKNGRKRNVAQLDVADATTLGTPGDGPASKRGRKTAAGVGDKSTFSITPFLNKTAASVAPDSDWSESNDRDASPAPPPRKQAKKPLTTRPASKSNEQTIPARQQPQQEQQKPHSALEVVAEEAGEEEVHSHGQENAIRSWQQTQHVKTKMADGPSADGEPSKKSSRPRIRKSIHDFATFAAADAAAVTRAKKKPRRLGGLGRTLFDEEDDAAAAPAPAPGGSFVMGKNLFGTMGFGALGARGKKRGGGIGSSFLGGGAASGSTLLISAADGSGFQFSPLKRGRTRNLDDTLRG